MEVTLRCNCTAGNLATRIAGALSLADSTDGRKKTESFGSGLQLHSILPFTLNLFSYVRKSNRRKDAGTIVAIGKESYEKRSRSLFQVSGGCSDSSLEREDFFRLQR